MLYISKIDDCLQNIDWWERKGFVAINFSEYVKSMRREGNLRKIAKPLYIFIATPDQVENYVKPNSSNNCIHHYNVDNLNLSDPELQLIYTKPVIKGQIKRIVKWVEKRLKFS